MLELLTTIPVTVWMVATLVFLVTYHYINKPTWKLPPGPPNLPIVGSLPFIRGDIRHVMARCQKKYGDVFLVHVGPEKTVFLNGYNTIKEALLKTSGSFDGRSVNHFKDLSNNLGVITSQGPLWKEQRRYLLHVLRDFGLGKRGMEDCISDEASELVSALSQHAGGKPYDLRDLFHQAVANVIMTVVKGDRYEYGDPEIVESVQGTMELLKLIGTNNPVFVFTSLQYLPGDMFGYHKCRTILHRLHGIYRKWIKEHRRAFEAGEGTTDLIGVYITEMANKRQDEEHYFSDDQLIQIIVDIFLAGTDTTSNTLAFCMLYLISYPDTQKKVQDEIDEVIGKDRRPTMTDRNNMPYTDAFINEVQRIINVVPLAVPHGAMANTEFHGYTIPEASTVIVNLQSVLWDPTIFPNPEKFEPERFLREDGGFKKIEEMIPFSIGKRACLGEALARMELFLVFTGILQKFNFSVPPGQPDPDTEGIVGITYHPKPFSVSITSR